MDRAGGSPGGVGNGSGSAPATPNVEVAPATHQVRPATAAGRAPAEWAARLLRDEARAALLGVVVNALAPKQVQRYGLSCSHGAGWTCALARR